MKKKVFFMTLIGLVLFGAVLAAALNAVFTVTDVKVEFSVISDDGRADSVSLQQKLETQFVGKSTTFLDLDEVRTAVEEYPCFKLEKAVKDFPRTVVLSVTERKELLAVPLDGGNYAILDEEGNYLYEKAENLNRRKGENILLEGFELQRTGNGVTGKYYSDALTFLKVFTERFGDARANIRSFSLVPTGNAVAGDYLFRLFMREGVRVDVYAPSYKTSEKAEIVLEKYLSLSDTQKLYGFFDVIDDLTGVPQVSEHRAELPVSF